MYRLVLPQSVPVAVLGLVVQGCKDVGPHRRLIPGPRRRIFPGRILVPVNPFMDLCWRRFQIRKRFVIQIRKRFVIITIWSATVVQRLIGGYYWLDLGGESLDIDQNHILVYILFIHVIVRQLGFHRQARDMFNTLSQWQCHKFCSSSQCFPTPHHSCVTFEVFLKI